MHHHAGAHVTASHPAVVIERRIVPVQRALAQ